MTNKYIQYSILSVAMILLNSCVKEQVETEAEAEIDTTYNSISIENQSKTWESCTTVFHDLGSKCVNGSLMACTHDKTGCVKNQATALHSGSTMAECEAAAIAEANYKQSIGDLQQSERADFIPWLTNLNYNHFVLGLPWGS